MSHDSIAINAERRPFIVTVVVVVSGSITPLSSHRHGISKHDVAAQRCRPTAVIFDDFNISDVRCRRRPLPGLRPTSSFLGAMQPRSGAPPAGVAGGDRTVDVLKWMFLRLRDVDTSLCFTAAAAVTTDAAARRGEDECYCERR